MKRSAARSIFLSAIIGVACAGLGNCNGGGSGLPDRFASSSQTQSGTTNITGTTGFTASNGDAVTFDVFDSQTTEALPNVSVTYLEGSTLAVIQSAGTRYAPAVFYDTAAVTAASIGLTVKGVAESAKDYYDAVVYVDNKMDEAFMNPNASGVICMTAQQAGELIYNEQAGTSIARSALLLLSSSLIGSDPLSLFGVIGSELAETAVLDFIDHLLAYQLNGIMAPDDLIAVRFRSHDPVQFTLAGLYLQDVYELTAATPELCGDIGNIPPSVKPGRGEPTGSDSALLTGTVHPNGLETTVYFRWGPTPALGKQTVPQIISGDSALPVTAPITGLAPWTLYYFRLIATNSKGLTARDGWFFMNGPDNGYPSIVTDSLPAGKVGRAYGPVTLQASGGNPPITWRALADILPPGLRLDTSGKITGTPTTAGEYGLLVQAEDSWFFHRLVTKTIPIAIEPQVTANQNPVITQLTASPASVTTGGTVELACNASDADDDVLTYSWSKTAGTISGTGPAVTWTAPTLPGTYRVTCGATDGKGGTASRMLPIRASANGVVRPMLAASASPSYHTCALRETGTLKCWGDTSDGQTGLGDYSDPGGNGRWGDQPGEMGDNLPAVDLGTGRTAMAVTAGWHRTCALLDTGQVKCWGAGWLGLGDTISRGDDPAEMGDNLPSVDLGTGRTAVQVSAGYDHTCALLDTSQVKCWGNNNGGRLGLGDVNDRGDALGEMGDDLPTVNLGVDHAIVQVAAGANHVCALLDTGKVKCWGVDLDGALGLGDYIDPGLSGAWGDQPSEMGDNLPVIDLGTGRTATHITAGYNTCALLDTGQVKCWGSNLSGALGLGDYIDPGLSGAWGDQPGEMGDKLPTVDLGAGRIAIGISAGANHTCALLDTGKVKCWGSLYSGLGLGDYSDPGGSGEWGDQPGEMGDNLPNVDLGTGRTAVEIVAGWDHTCTLLDANEVKCFGNNNRGQVGLGDYSDPGGSGEWGDQPDEMGDNLPTVDLGTP